MIEHVAKAIWLAKMLGVTWEKALEDGQWNIEFDDTTRDTGLVWRCAIMSCRTEAEAAIEAVNSYKQSDDGTESRRIRRKLEKAIKATDDR